MTSSSAAISTSSTTGEGSGRAHRQPQPRPFCVTARGDLPGELSELPPEHTYLGFFLLQHGMCLTKLRRFDEAETELLEAHDIHVAALTEQHAESRRNVQALIDLYNNWDKQDQAAQWRTVSGDTK